MTTLHGVPVSPGRAAGAVVQMPPRVPEPPLQRLPAGADLDAAASSIEEAARAVAAELQETPARAVWEAAQEIAAQLESLGGVMAERAYDVRDVRDRIVARLSGRRSPGVPAPGHPFVLVASDLAPADTATLDPAECLALVTEGGGPTSHTAILARALGIPAVVAVAGALGLADGETVLVDGGRGVVEREPEAAAVAAAQAARRSHRAFSGRGATADGVAVELLANVADTGSAAAAAAAGAEGVGLFRTEFLFLGALTEPAVEQQTAAYRGVFEAFSGRKVVIRTLDAGADKPLPFLNPVKEPNPALGVRGLRTATRHPDVLDRQLQAIAAAAAAQPSTDVWVMAPMVSTPQEAEEFATRCAAHGIEKPGVMIEVPAAALGARWVLEPVTFASLGTNDLTQYAMAADRETGALAELSTAWQPAVLRLVQATWEGAVAAGGRPVGVCGEAAGDPALAPVLVGLGATSLSMAPAALGDVSAVLAATTSDRCRELAELALAARDARAARDLVRAELPILDELAL